MNEPNTERSTDSGSAASRRGIMLRKALNVAPIVLALVGTVLVVWQVVSFTFDQSRDTASIQLTREEVSALKQLLKPAPSAQPGGTRLSITQVRGLEERLSALEKLPTPAALSGSASSDLRAVQRDLDNLRDRQLFQGLLFKDQMSEFGTQTRWLMGIMLTINLAVIGFFWQISNRRNDY